MIKNTIKSILALALVACCGMAQAASNGATSAGDTTGSFSDNNHTYTVTGLKYINPSGNDSANRNERGWYAGITITWPMATKKVTGTAASSTYAEVTDNIKSHTYDKFKVYELVGFTQTWYNDKVGSGISGLGGDSYWTTMYITSATWWAHITPEDAYKLKDADYTATLSIAGETFKIVIPATTYNAGLVDTSTNVQWFPAVALIGTKVYGDLGVALTDAASQGSAVNMVANGTISSAVSVPENSGLNLTKGSYTISFSGSGHLTLAGGTFDFDPKAVYQDNVTIADGYEVVSTDSKYVVQRSHQHNWGKTLSADHVRLTATCNNATGCDVPNERTVYIELRKTSGGTKEGEAPKYEIYNSDDFLKYVNRNKPGMVSIGAVNIGRTEGDGASRDKWYVGSYRATCEVTWNGETITLYEDFAIAKPGETYVEGAFGEGENYWVSGLRNVRYHSWEEAATAALDGDTIYCYDSKNKTRNFSNHTFNLGERNVTLDFRGRTLSNVSSSDLPIVSEGTGTLTFQNTTIKQPRTDAGIFSVAGHLKLSGNIVFGTGVVVKNSASSADNYCTLTADGSLIVSNGLYQCGFAKADGATVLLEGGKYWEYDEPAIGQYDLADRVCREIEEVIGGVTYKYEIVEHVHVFAYTAEGVVITCKCVGEDATYCYWNELLPKATLTANDADESSEPYAGASVSYDTGFIDQTQPITYWQGDEQLSGAPTRFGTYTAKLTVGEATAWKSFTIALAENKTDNEIKIGTGDEALDVKIPSAFISEQVVTAGKTTEEIVQALNEDGANGISKIESYVLGLDPKVETSVPVVLPVQTSSATTLRLDVGGISVKTDAGVKVKYSIETATKSDFSDSQQQGEAQDGTVFDGLPLPASGVMYYRAKIDLVKPQ